MVIVLKGKIVSGVGEGRRYVELYKNVLAELLGSDPYPGTLNLELEVCFYNITGRTSPLLVKPPNRDLGVVYAYRGWIENVKILLLKPSITRHDCNIVEVISTVHLRSRFGLKDGDLVDVVIED